MVTSSNRFDSDIPLYRKLNALPLTKLIKLKIANTIHNHSNNCLPATFDQYFKLTKLNHSLNIRFSFCEKLFFQCIKLTDCKDQLNLFALKYGTLLH